MSRLSYYRPLILLFLGISACPCLVTVVFVLSFLQNVTTPTGPLIGDTVPRVHVYSLTGVPVTFAFFDDTETRAVLDPGQTAVARFGTQDLPKWRAEARDNDGVLIFCRRYTSEELSKNRWTIELMPNTLECAPEE